MESLLFLRIGVNFSPVERFLALKRWKRRFGQNVLRMAWKARFVQFLYKAYCFNVLAWISVRWSNFWLWNVEKCDLVKTSSALPEKHVLYNFHTKPTAFKNWRKFQSGKAIFVSKTLKNEIWPKRPSNSLKSTFCTIFSKNSRLSIKIVQNVLFRHCGGKMRFGQTVLRIASKARLLQFWYKAYTFHVLAWILVRWSDFWSKTLTFWPNLIFNVLDPKIALPDWNSRQYWKAYCFYVLARISVR